MSSSSWTWFSRRQLAVLLALLLVQPVAVAGLAAPAEAAPRSFTPPHFSVNTTGDIAQIGNTLLTCPAGDPNWRASSRAWDQDH